MKIIILFILLTGVALADVNILIIGSGRSYSEGRGSGQQDALNPKLIAGELRNILSKDRAVGKVNISVDEYYTKKHIDTSIGGRAGSIWQLEYHRYSLAQYYFWPEGRADRLKNLQGKLKNKWNYVVLIDDPYLTLNMPGIHAEGVKLLTQKIREGGAKALLFSQWPRPDSKRSQKELNEISYRVAKGLGIAVVPAGEVWSSLKKANKSIADSLYIAAASIYRTIRPNNRSSYIYKDRNLSAHCLKAIRVNRLKSHYKGDFKTKTPFTKKAVSRRQVWGHHTGTSTERGLTKQLQTIFGQSSILFNKGKKPAKQKIDFNYGRANSAFEPNKRYKVAPDKYDRSYGIVMQDNGKTAYNTMLYGIDKRTFLGKSQVDDGTDMGIAYDMIQLKEVEKDIRAIPGRLISAKIMDYDKTLIPVNTKGDTWHQRGHLLLAQASYVSTLLSGRYSIDITKEQSGQNWMMAKIGYDTAWTMSTLRALSPGLIIRPSNTNLLAMKKDQQETMTIFFTNKPRATVKVLVSVNGKGTKMLTFTALNYNKPQTFTFENLGNTQTISFKTQSKDPVYNSLIDSWKYGSL